VPREAKAQTSLAVGMNGDRFTVNGVEQFLLFISYFDGLGASQATLDSDFAALKSRGFGGIRVLIDWPCTGGCSGSGAFRLFNPDGSYQSGNLVRLTNFLQTAQANGLVVDLTFQDWVDFNSFQAYQTAVTNATRDTMSYRGVIFDLQNEFNAIGPMTYQQALALRNAVKAVDPNRLVTLSTSAICYPGGGCPVDIIINNTNPDFLTLHGPFVANWWDATDDMINLARANSPRSMPIYNQEPLRYDPAGASTAANFITGAQNAKCAGAAAWTFHTTAGYDLTTGTIFSHFNSVEAQAADGFGAQLNSTVWYSCATGGGGGYAYSQSAYGGGYSYSQAAYSGGGGATGVTSAYDCGPANPGYVYIGGANASVGDPSGTPGYYADDDGMDPSVTGMTYPMQAIITCTASSGTAFIAPSWTWPSNCRPSSNGTCLYNPNQSTSAANNQGWTFSGGTPHKGGSSVPLIASVNCPGTVAFTIPDANFTAGAWTTSPSTAGAVCVRGTVIKPTTIDSIEPTRGTNGTSVVIYGVSLGPVVKAVGTTGQVFMSVGEVDYKSTQMTWIVPDDLPPDVYTISVGPDATTQSNTETFTLLPWDLAAIPPPTGPPEIISFSPGTVYQGHRLQINGQNLTENVIFNSINGEKTTMVGWVSTDRATTIVEVPLYLPEGVYTLTVFGEGGDATTTDSVTVTANNNSLSGGTGFTPTSFSATSFGSLISTVFTYSFYLVGLAVFVMIVWGGLLWITAAGNSSQIGLAKHKIFNAIIGAIILLSAYLILYTINPALVGGGTGFVLPGLK